MLPCVRALLFAACSLLVVAAQAEQHTVVLYQAGFPAADSAALSLPLIRSDFPSAQVVTAAQLPAALADAKTDLLVMPYGSAYPEAAWPAILRYLDRGGNLIVIGGKPFTRAAYSTTDGWKLRAPSVAQSLELFIHDYQETPGSDGLTFEPNENITPAIPEMKWERAFSPVIRLSVIDVDHHGGATGDDDAELTTLAWGKKDATRLAAPAFLIDHNRYRFVGGRWIFLACRFGDSSLPGAEALSTLQTLALRRNDRFTLRPRLPLLLPGEPIDMRYEQPHSTTAAPAGDQLQITVTAEEDGTPVHLTVAADSSQPLVLPADAATGRGLHTVQATLLRDGHPLSTYRSGFWLRDQKYLLSAPRLTVGKDYFQLNGQPLPVVGTTYMASDVDRLYLAKPNAYLWCRDLSQIRAEGLNMIRTGLWTAWDRELAADGEVSEDGLRTLEALLMCARHADLPVQFNLFAFVPDNLGGEHPYLDPAALHAQQIYVRSLVNRFRDIPFLAWDLINEPSANKNVWKTLPQNEAFENAAWKDWLEKRYPDRAALLDAWAEPSFGMGRQLQRMPTSTSPETAAADPFELPAPGAFAPDQVRSGYNPLKVYDYYGFTQSVFVDWARGLQELIRSTGSRQLTTIGQDEGGVAERISPAFYSPLLDFTADHTWWDFDSALWASLAAKFPGKPMLIQETGEQRRLTQDDHLRFTAEEEGWQLERKLATAFAQGAGALEWVWNVNSHMANDNEIPIGAIRPDGTEKPEAQILSNFAKFVFAGRESFTTIAPPDVTIVTSQAMQYTGMIGVAIAAQKKAVRALTYYRHMPARMLPENRLADIGQPKLVILPSPQALTEAAWQQLLQYVERGGCLLVSGPVARDEHWKFFDRLSSMGLSARTLPLMVRQSSMQLPDSPETIQISFPTEIQQLPFEVLRFNDGRSVQTIARGKGHIVWATDPVELSDGYASASALYGFALKIAGVKPSFTEVLPLSPGVLAFPTELTDAVLYSFSSESLDSQQIDLLDAATGAHLRFALPAQRGAAILLRRSDGHVLSAYGPAAIAPR